MPTTRLDRNVLHTQNEHARRTHLLNNLEDIVPKLWCRLWTPLLSFCFRVTLPRGASICQMLVEDAKPVCAVGVHHDGGGGGLCLLFEYTW